MRRYLVALTLGTLLLAGCGASPRHGSQPPTRTPVPATSTPPPPTSTPTTALSRQDFYNLARWVDSNPKGCAAYLDSMGVLIVARARYHRHDQVVLDGLTYLAVLTKYCRRRDWSDTKAAADVMAAWANGD